ncbi:MAG: hypothetical protein WCS69_15235 [Ignavibacteriaceae bacterium]|jgi:hypothetical protein
MLIIFDVIGQIVCPEMSGEYSLLSFPVGTNDVFIDILQVSVGEVLFQVDLFPSGIASHLQP